MATLINPSNNYIPVYHLITEITNETNLHWTLSPFVAPYIARKNNLASLLTLIGTYEICRIIGPSREEEFFARRKISMKHQLAVKDPISPPAGDSIVWNRYIGTLQHLICEGVPLHLVKSQVASSADLKSQQSSPSDVLLNAVVLRTLQLIQFSGWILFHY